MKKQKKPVAYVTKIRWAAGAVYLILAVYQMLCVKSIIDSNATSPSYYLMGWTSGGVFAMLLMLLSGGLAVWLLSGYKAVERGTKRGIVIATIFWIFIELMGYTAQSQLISDSLSPYLPIVAQLSFVRTLLIGLRLVLLVLAAFIIMEDEPEEGLEDLEEIKLGSKGTPKTKGKGKKGLQSKKDDKKTTSKKADEEEPEENEEETEAEPEEEPEKNEKKSAKKDTAKPAGKKSGKKKK